MEEQLSPLAVTHLLQHTLRSLCGHDDAQWVYAVFWRILPRNYPPPKWDLQGGIYDRTRGNRRNWYHLLAHAYSSLQFLMDLCLSVRDSWVAKPNQIICAQDPGMGGWILQLRSLCL
uniref:Transcription factor MYC/MYB N-terminal domain-containing protein n=1 Tax=Zea mays TaxID=4577 RepID=C4J1G5_MAIZE|nr:unknown [Zea mays]